MKEESCHNQHQHSSPGMGHGSADEFLHKFWIVTFLLIPLVGLNGAVANALGLPVFEYGGYVSFALATIIFYFSLVFFKHAKMELEMKKPGMMTLVSMAVLAGYAFSVVATFVPSLGIEFYLEISTLIWVLLFGHYLEAKSSSAAGNALQEVAKLLPSTAHLQTAYGEVKDIEVLELKVGDIVLIKPGERVPADGEVIKGNGHIDESLISGESKPVNKVAGDSLVSGSIVVDTTFTMRVTRVGADSTVGQIQKLIEQAQNTKPSSQKLADKAASVLTAVAAITALLTLVVWTFLLGQPFVFAVTLAITVLVIACPHALGLAIPTVTTIATSLSTKNGFFVKDLSKLEVVKRANVVVFDKTGTLTEGVFGIASITPQEGLSDEELLRIAASLEQYSSHVIAQTIVNKAKEDGIEIKEVEEFKNIAGKGISGLLNSTEYLVGNARLMNEYNIKLPKESVLGTIVYVANTQELLGTILLADTIKPEAKEAIKQLKELGVTPVMLTGDNDQVAKVVAQELGIDKYYADVLPEDKYKYIKELQEDGGTVLMVGDGVNDAPALTQADVGVAIGAGTDVAVEAGDVVLTRSNPLDIVRLIKLSKAVYKKMVENLVWALGYNVVAIPAAAGVFAVWGFFLRPEIGAFVMSLSTVIVVANAMLLKRIKLN